MVAPFFCAFEQDDKSASAADKLIIIVLNAKNNNSLIFEQYTIPMLNNSDGKSTLHEINLLTNDLQPIEINYSICEATKSSIQIDARSHLVEVSLDLFPDSVH